MEKLRRNYNLIFGLVELIFLGLNIILYFHYTFEAIHDIAFVVFISLLFILVTIFSVKYRNIQTKPSKVFGILIPLFTIVFIISLEFIMKLNSVLNAIIFIIPMICSLIIFSKIPKTAFQGHVFIAILVLLYLPILGSYILMILFSDFVANTIRQTVNSPYGTYSAWVVDSDQGALGGDTLVNVRNLKKDIPLIIGTLKSKELRIHSGHWSEEISLEWKDENHLILNGKEHKFP